MTNTYEPVEIDPHDRALLEKIGRLRVLAWSTVMPDAAQKAECWLDEFELIARHWCIFHDGEPVAAARMSVHHRVEETPDAEVYDGVLAEPPPAPIASFNRLVAHPSFRGRGFSRKLDEVRLRAALSVGCQSAIGETHAGEYRLNQLKSLGFRVIGPSREYPDHHFLTGSGAVLLCDLVALQAGVRPTNNRMGWSGDAINEVSQQFIQYARQCSQPVLDIGAAYGVATIPALAAGATVIANDLSPEHLVELRRRTPRDLRTRLTTMPGRFPTDIDFPPESLAAVHASQVLHFLTGDQVQAGLRKVFDWLQPGGRLFVLAGTPYTATHRRFVEEFHRRKALGDEWPGWIEDLREYNKHWSADLLPASLHVFDEDVLATAVRRAGFVILEARLFSRTGLPEFYRLDGRENLGLIAKKPAC